MQQPEWETKEKLPSRVLKDWYIAHPDEDNESTTNPSKIERSHSEAGKPVDITQCRQKKPVPKGRLHTRHPLHTSNHVVNRNRMVVVVPSMARLPDRTKLQDNPALQEEYARGVLVMFKPFRDMDDLKKENQSKSCCCG
jgi:hypothetical protein